MLTERAVKKNLLAATIVVLLGLSVFFVWLNLAVKKPLLEFAATDASADWLTYASAQNGFHIKYPPKGWTVGQSGETENARIVDFSKESSDLSLSVRYFPTSVRDRIAEYQSQGNLNGRGKIGLVKVSGTEVTTLTYIIGNFNVRWSVADLLFSSHSGTSVYHLFFPGPSGTYEISVTSAYLSHPEIREMIGTFGTSEMKRSDYLTNDDPYYHFSYTYPTAWHLSFWEGKSTLQSMSLFESGADYRITFDVMPNTTLGEHMERFGGFPPKIGEKQEYFAHKLLGWKYADGEKEGYYFEKEGNLYHIHIYRIKGPRKPVDDVLESFGLAP